VLLGRPVLWALAAGGADGVRACLRAVSDDLAHVMALAGPRSLDEVSRDLVDGWANHVRAGGATRATG